MLIDEKSISFKLINIYTLNDKKIGIPIFQRFYAWKEKEVTQFKEDLLKIINNQNKIMYFLDFIYYKEDGILKFADGQQRIVTLNNLIKAIKDVAKEKDIEIEDIKLFDIEYDISSNNDIYKKHFEKILVKPFKEVYLSLYNFINENISRIDDFVKVIKNNIFVILKECANADEAYNIFQQINTGGKPLTKDEVIKTALDQYSKVYDIEFDTKKIKDIYKSLISYYKFTSNDYDKNFDNMQIMSFLKEHIIKDKKAYENFTKTFELLKKLNNNPLWYVIKYINRTTLMDVLNILAMKNIDTSERKDYLNDVVLPLCMMSIVLTLKGGSPTTFRYILNEIIEDIKSDVKPEDINHKLIVKIDNSKTTWAITETDFKEKLGDKETPKNLKKALLIIDVIISNASGMIDVSKIHLEHIYPQKPSNTWNKSGWPVSKEEQKEIVDNIGNYLLLNKKINTKIQNSYISEKRKYYDSTKDIILNTKTNEVDFSKFEDNREKYIKERQKNIGDLIIKNFPFGRVLIKENQD